MPKGTTKKAHRYNFGRLRLFIIVGVLIYVVFFMVNHQGDVAAQVQRQEELTKTQSELEQQVQYYTNELDYIGTDEYVEQEARNRFGWLKEGEIKYVEGTTQTTEADSSEAPASSYTDDPSNSPSTAPSQGSENEGVTASGALSD